MQTGLTMTLPNDHDLLAPDGSEVRVLLSLAAGGMAHFRLQAGQVSRAVRHRTVGEIWYVLSGSGQMWRSCVDDEHVADLAPGTCLTIPVGTAFQFRAAGSEPLAVVAATIPPWPGEAEAELVAGKWAPTV